MKKTLAAILLILIAVPALALPPPPISVPVILVELDPDQGTAVQLGPFGKITHATTERGDIEVSAAPVGQTQGTVILRFIASEGLWEIVGGDPNYRSTQVVFYPTMAPLPSPFGTGQRKR